LSDYEGNNDIDLNFFFQSLSGFVDVIRAEKDNGEAIFFKVLLGYIKIFEPFKKVLESFLAISRDTDFVFLPSWLRMR